MGYGTVWSDYYAFGVKITSIFMVNFTFKTETLGSFRCYFINPYLKHHMAELMSLKGSERKRSSFNEGNKQAGTDGEVTKISG